MGLFSKKKDPIKAREQALASEIEQLEDQIRALQGVLKTAKDEPAAPPQKSPPVERRATVKSPVPDEPVFEPVDQQRLQNAGANPFKEKHEPRTLQKEGSTSFIERVIRFFKGPTSSNPKLVSYLAAGNIHGLQPLRYERRVARNRLLLWIVVIVVLIVGMLKWLMP